MHWGCATIEEVKKRLTQEDAVLWAAHFALEEEEQAQRLEMMLKHHR